MDVTLSFDKGPVMRLKHLLAVLVVALFLLLGAYFRFRFTEHVDGEDVGADPRIQSLCAACHVFPPPEILPRDAWPTVVTKMFEFIRSRPDIQPTVDAETVTRYFQLRAPPELETPPWRPDVSSSGLRLEARSLGVDQGTRVLQPVDPGTAPGPGVSNVRLVELFVGVPGLELLACDMLSGTVSWADPDDPNAVLKPLATLTSPAHAEVVDLDGDGLLDLLVADLGAAVSTDERRGAVVLLQQREGGEFIPIRLATDLGRVADARAADFDGDGDLDVVVAAFGLWHAGGILYMENITSVSDTKLQFRRTTLDPRQGAIHVPIVDLDRDGRPDFIALISQEHEAVVAFLNRGEGFEQQPIFAAPQPDWGMSGIEILDMDGDGDLDVLVTNGDTLDWGIRLKPQHGVTWLENEGSYPFTPHLVGRYYGVFRAEAADMDGDGDLDIVASSFLPGLDETRRREMGVPGVIWYEQVSRGRFRSRPLVDDSCQHVTLTLGDFDGDGRIDISTGRLRMEPVQIGPHSAPVDLFRNLGGE